jgi:hypothetical protein
MPSLRSKSSSKQDVEFVGYIVGKGGVQMMQDKSATIRDWPAPQTVTDTKSFLGFATFYVYHVANFAAIAQPHTVPTIEQHVMAMDHH